MLMKSFSDPVPESRQDKQPWKDLVLAALIEMELSKMPARIAEARAAIRKRSDELTGRTETTQELSDLRDGMHTLQSLENMMRNRSMG